MAKCAKQLACTCVALRSKTADTGGQDASVPNVLFNAHCTQRCLSSCEQVGLPDATPCQPCSRWRLFHRSWQWPETARQAPNPRAHSSNACPRALSRSATDHLPASASIGVPSCLRCNLPGIFLQRCLVNCQAVCRVRKGNIITHVDYRTCLQSSWDTFVLHCNIVTGSPQAAMLFSPCRSDHRHMLPIRNEVWCTPSGDHSTCQTRFECPNNVHVSTRAMRARESIASVYRARQKAQA
jgi:hypothetical protein